MRKRLLSMGLVGALCVTSLFMMTGCGEKLPYDDYDLSEYVTLGDYEGLEYDEISVSVSDDEVQEEIASRCEAAATTEDQTTGTVEDGDTINISYEGRIDGETFDGGSSDDYDFTVGVTNFIDGFSDGLLGQSVGSTVTLNLTFPDDYSNEDVAGKDVVFEVSINSKQVTVVPEYDLDFVKDNSDYDNLEDYEASVKEELLESKTETATNEVKQALWEQIYEACEVTGYPEGMVDEEVESRMADFKQEAEDNDMEWDDYLDAIGYSEDELTDLLTTYFQDKIGQEMIVYYLAEKLDVEVTKSEYNDEVQRMLDTVGMDADTFEESYGYTPEEYLEENYSLRVSLLLDKAMDKVIELGVAKPADSSSEESSDEE